MSILGAFRRVAMAAVAGLSLSATAADEFYPSLDTNINNFDPTVPVGRYVQQISSNTVENFVMLSDGILTVGPESINVAEPTHMTVVTNIVGGVAVVTTNYSDAVYQDGLVEALREYARIRKITSITTNNFSGVVTTNWTEVAYRNDIPSDEKKADKVMRLYDYALQGPDVLLTRVLKTDAPFAAWEGTYPPDGTTYRLTHVNGVWCISDDELGVSSDYVEGAIDAPVIQFPHFAPLLYRTNDTRYAYVVYTDMMEDALDQRMTDVVSKTNLLGIASRIEEDKLHTIGGIQEILRGIRSEINTIAGGSGIHLTFTNVGGATLVLNAAEMRIEGDMVEIDWGDGSEKEMTYLPASHSYADDVGDVDVVITGFIREISGTTMRGEGDIMPFAGFTDNDNSRLVSVQVDSIVGLESIGFAAFYGCGGLTSSLSFIPETVVNLGERCFSRSGITSLSGIPVGVTRLPRLCFSECNGLINLSGLSPGIKEIGDGAFSLCDNLTSLVGIPKGVATLGSSVFSSCASLSSVEGLVETDVMNIPAYGFAGTSIASLAGFPSVITNIGEYAFYEARLMTIPDVFTNLISIGEAAFASSYSSPEEADFSSSRIEWIGRAAFSNSQFSVVWLPASVSVIGENALSTDMGTAFHVDKMTSDLIALDGFPCGASESARFFCVDGEIYYEDGERKILSTRTTLLLSCVPEGNHTIEIVEAESVAVDGMYSRSVSRSATPNVIVDWGDGTIDASTTHVYSLPSETNISVSVIGRLKRMSGSGEKPFITVDALATNSYLTSVVFGDGVEIRELGDGTFKNCTSLSDAGITGIGPLLETIGEGCFEHTGVRDLSFLSASSVKSYPVGCFRRTKLLSLGGMSQYVETIGDECFKECETLSDISALPGSLQSIGISAFEGCARLNNDSISSLSNTRVVTLPRGCFKGCLGITAITNGLESITTIGEDAFANCTKITDVAINSLTSIGKNAFYAIGSDENIVPRVTEDNIPYRVAVDVIGGTFKDAADILGLEQIDPLSGLVKADTIVNCANNASLVWNDSSAQRWEVVVDALTISLEGVPDGQQFQVQANGAMPFEGAMVIWNWGDGTNSGWVNGVPPSHTYYNSGASNYLVKVRGLLSSISSASTVGPFIRPAGSTENPYLTGFEIPSGSTIRNIGNYTFSKCPNLRAVNEIESPRSPLSAPEKKKMSARAVRSLSTLYDEVSSTGGTITFGEYCFEDAGVITLSTFPKDIESLPIGLFHNCKELSSLQGLGAGIIDMGDYCFAGATSLVSLTGFPLGLTYIANNGFYGCSSLQSLDALSETGLSSIGDYSFYGCGNLTSLSGLPSSLTYIGEGAFAASGIVTTEGLPDWVYEVEPYAFSNCTNLETVVSLPRGMKKISEGMFTGCSSLSTIKGIPTNITDIGRLGFALCENLSSVTLHGGITNIEDFVLLNVGHSAEQIVDEAGIVAATRIDVGDFSCADLITLLSATSNTNPFVEFICRDGFVINVAEEWVPLLKTIVFNLEHVKGKSTFMFGTLDVKEGTELIVDWGDGNTETYTSGLSHQYAVSGDYRVTLYGFVEHMSCSPTAYPILRASTGGNPNLVSFTIGTASRVYSLGDYCFKGCSALRSIGGMANSSILELGKECFKECSSLSSLEGMPYSILSLGEGCFEGCTALRSMEGLAGDFRTLPTNCFANCTGITTISNMPGFIGCLSERCFAGCSNLVSLVGMEQAGAPIDVEGYVFEGCTSLVNLYGYGTNHTSLANGLFANCTGLSSLEGISPDVAFIPDNCFMGCTSLTSLSSVPRGVMTIGCGAFRGCSGLTSLEGLPDNVVDIGDYAFAECSLKSLTGFPEGSASVGEAVFADNIGLADISALSAVTGVVNISTCMFSGCTSLGLDARNIILPSNTDSIGDRAFENCGIINPIEIPVPCRRIGERAFASTYLPSILINASSIELIGEEAFADGKSMAVDTMTYGSRIVYFPQTSPESICNMTNFPWGASNTTLFYGSNGFIINHEGSWVIARETAGIDISIADGSAMIAVEGVVADDNHGVCIDWGDGQISYWVTNGLSATRLYETAGDYKITIYRRIHSFGNVSSGTIPCLRKTSGNGELEVSSVSITDYSGCVAVGRYAFAGMTSLSELPRLPDYVATLGEGCFKGCTAIKEVALDLPLITALPNSVFAEDEAISNIVLTCPLMTIVGTNAFYECKRVEHLDFTETALTTLCANSFYNCTGVRQIDLPRSLSRIEETAFHAVGSELSMQTDEAGNSFKAMIVLADRTCSEFIDELGGDVTSATGMFDAPTTTKFVCIDGDVVWSETQRQWIVNYGKSYIILSGVPAGTSFSVASLTADTPGITWDWGDGTVVSNCTSGASVGNHTYNQAGDYHIRITGKVRSIGGYSIERPFLTSGNGNPYMTAITISDANPDFAIGSYAFANCSRLSTIAGISSPYSSIGAYAFYGCTALSAVVIPKHCAAIREYSFANCSGLSSVEFLKRDGVSIGAGAFSDSSLSRLTIPGSIMPSLEENSLVTPERLQVMLEGVIGDDAFPSLTTKGLNTSSIVYVFDGDILYENDQWVFKSKVISITFTLQPTPPGFGRNVCLEMPTMAPGFPRLDIDWGDGGRSSVMGGRQSRVRHLYRPSSQSTYTVRLVGRVTTLHGHERTENRYASDKFAAFMYGGKLEDAYVSMGMPDDADIFCVDLSTATEVSIGEGVGLLEIGAGCFYGLSGLKTITLPSTITNLGTHAFMKSGITSLPTLPRGLETLPAFCFSSCSRLASLDNIPTNITSIGESCFSDTAISSLSPLASIPIVSLGRACFMNNDKLCSLQGLPPSLRTLGEWCFGNCSITNFYGLPDGITYIPYACFCRCMISSFAGMPSTVERLDRYSIYPYYGENLIGMPQGIDKCSTLEHCPNLTSLDGLSTNIHQLCEIGEGGVKMKTVIIPPHIDSIGYGAFKNGRERIVLKGRTEDAISHTIDYTQRTLVGNTSPWISGTIRSYSRVVFVNGAAFTYEGTGSAATVKKHKPYMRAVLFLPYDNISIDVGAVTLYDEDTPVIWDWGDGNVEYLVGTTPSRHTYARAGKYTIVITTMATGISGYGDGPFLSWKAGYNPFLREFSFSDSVGLKDIGSSCFKNCQTLFLVKCEPTLEEAYFEFDNDGQIVTTGTCPTVLLLDSSYTTKQMQELPNYPWGLDLKTGEVRGIDQSGEIASQQYMKFNLVGVPKGTTLRVHSYTPKKGNKTIIHWGDGKTTSHSWNHQTSAGADRGHYHTYSKDGDYSIVIEGEAEGPGPRGVDGECPCIYVRSPKSLQNRNPYLREVIISSYLEITNIGADAFINCTALSKIDLSGTSIKSIGDRALMNTAVRDFGRIPESVVFIGNLAFNSTINSGRKISFSRSLADMVLAPTALGYVYSYASSWDIHFNDSPHTVLGNRYFPFAIPVTDYTDGPYTRIRYLCDGYRYGITPKVSRYDWTWILKENL